MGLNIDLIGVGLIGRDCMFGPSAVSGAQVLAAVSDTGTARTRGVARGMTGVTAFVTDEGVIDDPDVDAAPTERQRVIDASGVDLRDRIGGWPAGRVSGNGSP